MQRSRRRLNSGDAMKEIIEKISSYNLFNYLLPGILFAAFGDYITAYKIIQDDRQEIGGHGREERSPSL